jgi:hypothetical protein
VLITRYCYDDKIKEDKIGGVHRTHGRYEKKIVVREPEEKRPLGRCRHKWKNDMNRNLE